MLKFAVLGIKLQFLFMLGKCLVSVGSSFIYLFVCFISLDRVSLYNKFRLALESLLTYLEFAVLLLPQPSGIIGEGL